MDNCNTRQAAAYSHCKMHSFTTVSSRIAVRTTIHYSNVCCTEGTETYYRRVDLLICGLFQVEGRHELTAT